MTASEIRQSFLDFFAQRGHTIVPSASLLPDSPGLLFTNAEQETPIGELGAYYVTPGREPEGGVIVQIPPHRGSVIQTIVALAVVTLFLVNGLDPVLNLFVWMSQMGTLGILGLMALTSLSVLMFFMKDAMGESVLATKVLPLITGLVMVTVKPVCLNSVSRVRSLVSRASVMAIC